MTDVMEVWLDDATLMSASSLVGRLSRSRSRGTEAIRFRYEPGWLSARRNSFAIDPELPLTPGDFHPRAGTTLHGIFRDLAPDRWGRALMDRREADEAALEKRKPRRLSDWDYLAGVNDAGRMGALRLREPITGRWLDDRNPEVPPATRLRELEAAARAIEDEDARADPKLARLIRMLVVPGSSLGGTRPKASFTNEDGTLWLAKFPASGDRHDVGALEFVSHELAIAAGLDVPAAKLLSLGSRHHTFCVKRFDRTKSRRRLYASAMTLTQHDDGDPASYLDIAQALEREGDAVGLKLDLKQLYARIVFSILVCNRDDHLRNHGFLRGSTGWRLAPAFDINPNPGPHEHALAIDETDARPELETLRKTAALYRLDDKSASRIEKRARTALKSWRRVAMDAGLRGTDVEVLAESLEPQSR